VITNGGVLMSKTKNVSKEKSEKKSSKYKKIKCIHKK
jgi:hypothetical protein